MIIPYSHDKAEVFPCIRYKRRKNLLRLTLYPELRELVRLKMFSMNRIHEVRCKYKLYRDDKKRGRWRSAISLAFAVLRFILLFFILRLSRK